MEKVITVRLDSRQQAAVEALRHEYGRRTGGRPVSANRAICTAIMETAGRLKPTQTTIGK